MKLKYSRTLLLPVNPLFRRWVFTKSVKVEIKPEGKVSRAEVIIRIVYGIITGIILQIFLFIAVIFWILNFLSCLILAQRIAPEFVTAIIKQETCWMAYVNFVTDERPPLVPEF